MASGDHDGSASRSACHEMAVQLAACMEQTRCVREGGTILDCLRAKSETECEALRRAYTECRRSQLDMRSRIKGKRFGDTAATAAAAAAAAGGAAGGAEA